MLADCSDEFLETVSALFTQAFDLVAPGLADGCVLSGCASCLDAGDILGDLIDPGEMLGKRREAWVWRGMDLFFGRCAVGDQDGVDPIVLGSLQMELGVGPHLRRLEADDGEAVAAEMGDDVTVMRTGGFDPDPFHVVLAEPSGQGGVAIGRVIDLELAGSTADGDVELRLAGIDAGADDAMITHLQSPFLVMRTSSSFNHPGQTKSRSRSCYDDSLSASMGHDPTTGDPVRVATRTGSFLSE